MHPRPKKTTHCIGILLAKNFYADKSDTTYSPGTDEAADGDPVSAVVFEPDVEEAGLLRGPVAGVVSASSSHD